MSEGIIIALIGLCSGGLSAALLKLLEKFLGRAKDKSESDLGMRSELRLELDRKNADNKQLNIEQDALEAEVDNWRRKYWELFESFMKLKLFARRLADTPEEEKGVDGYTAPHETNTP